MPVETTVTASTSGLCAKTMRIPLEGVQVRAEITGAQARVTIAQRYRNRERQPIEAVYVFPLDEGAAVCAFEAVVNDGRYVAVVKPRDEAFAAYDDALAEGHGAFLLDEERPDVFTASVGNILPDSEVVIELTYVTELPFEGDAIRFTLPTTVSPRYAPAKDRVAIGRSEAEALNPPRADAVPYGLSITATASMPGRITRVESPSHPIAVSFEETRATITLSQETVPLDRDLVLVIGADAVTEPSVVVERDEAGRLAAAVTFRPPAQTTTVPADVVFLVDRSGSMQGSSMESVRHALQMCLRSLHAGCAFDIVGFGSTFTSLFDTLRPYNDASLAEASRHVAALDASLGGTEILPALEFVLAHASGRERPLQLVVLTDGQVTNTDEVLACATRHANHSRIFTFGIGHGASHHLVRGLARAGRGLAEFIAPGERLEATVLRQFARLLSPAFTQVRLEWTGVAARTTPAAPPPIFGGEVWRAYAWLTPSDANAWSAGQVTLHATSDHGAHAWTLAVDPSRIVSGRTVGTLAARARIRELEEGELFGRSKGSRQRERTASRETAEIIRLSTEYGLASRETSLVAVEHRDTPTLERAELRRVPVALTRGWGDADQSMKGAALMAGMPGAMTGRFFGAAPAAAGDYGDAFIDAAMIAPLGLPTSGKIPRAVRRRIARTLAGFKDAIASRAARESTPGSPVDVLIGLQRADGSWELDANLADAIGRPLADLERAHAAMPDGFADSRRLWATTLAVTFLRQQAPQRQVEWRLLVEKAVRWLRSVATDARSEERLWARAAEELAR